MLLISAVPIAKCSGCVELVCCRFRQFRLLDAPAVRDPDALDVGCPGCWTLRLCEARMLQIRQKPLRGVVRRAQPNLCKPLAH